MQRKRKIHLVLTVVATVEEADPEMTMRNSAEVFVLVEVAADEETKHYYAQ